MTAPFPTTEPMEVVQDKFASALNRARISHDAVQCPRGGEQSIIVMRQQGEHFSRTSGSVVVEIDWKP